MKLSRSWLLLPLLFFAASFAGCNGNVHVTGKVTYANGQPLTIGQVIFTDDYYMGRSDLDKNGEYSIHTLRRNDGIRKGTYRVYIVSAFRFEETEEIKDSLQNYRFDKPVQLIDDQYMNPYATGWVFEVKKNCKIDLVVYPPGEVPEEERTEEAKMRFDPEYRKEMQRKQALERGEDPDQPIHKKRRSVNPNLL